jgi:hypothetical protein
MMNYPTKFDDVLSRLEVVKSADGEYQIRCPAHEDRSPSMVATVNDDGSKLLLHCRAGCTTEAICEAAGIEVKELFASEQQPTKRSRIVETYSYGDENGVELYQVCRMDPKSFRQRHMVDGEWVWRMNGVRRVLFNLTGIIDHLSWPVVVLEGEKDCLRLTMTGLKVVPTTNAGGAGKWDSDYSVALAGRRVVVIPDNDNAGRKHAVDVAGSLIVYGAASIRIVDLPVDPGGDLSDYLASHKIDELVTLIKATPEWVTR